MNIREFQDDLNNGMTIEDACRKHKVSFKRAFEILHFKDTNQDKRKRPTPRRPLGNCGEAYIRYDEKREVYWLVTSNSLAYMDRDYNVTSIKKFPYTNNFDMLLQK